MSDREALIAMRDRDDRNGSLPPWYREQIDAALKEGAAPAAVVSKKELADLRSAKLALPIEQRRHAKARRRIHDPKLAEALKPFAKEAEEYGEDVQDASPLYAHDEDGTLTIIPLTVGDLRAARAALLAAAERAAPAEARMSDQERAREAATPAARDVLAERARQQSIEGWTLAHDDKHTDGSMAKAAAVYAVEGLPLAPGNGVFEALWRWDVKWWRPRSRRRNLVRAGALILAEIERLDRATPEQANQSNERRDSE